MAGKYIVEELVMRVMVFLSQIGSGTCELWINEEFVVKDITGYCRQLIYCYMV